MLKFTKSSNDGLNEIAYYDSSNIKKSYYNYSVNTLSIVFSNENVYIYDNVSEPEYLEFKFAESQGKVLNSNIKQKTFVKSGKETMEMIQEEENSHNQEFSESLFELSKNKMKRLIEKVDYDEVSVIDLIETLSKIVQLKKK